MTTAFYLRKARVDPAAKEERLARIEELENEVFERSAQIVSELLNFREVDPNQETPPQRWIDEVGAEEAEKMLRLAKLGHLPASHAPVGGQIALRALTGIARGRNYRVKLTQNTLNVKIALPAPTSAAHPGPAVYETREIEE